MGFSCLCHSNLGDGNRFDFDQNLRVTLSRDLGLSAISFIVIVVHSNSNCPTMENLDEKKNSNNNSDYSLVGGFTLLGVGLGLYFGQVAAGTLIGIGSGLVLTTLYRMNRK